MQLPTDYAGTIPRTGPQKWWGLCNPQPKAGVLGGGIIDVPILVTDSYQNPPDPQSNNKARNLGEVKLLAATRHFIAT